MNSLVIPIYRNEANIPDLLVALREMAEHSPSSLEVVFVVDGSPDASYSLLRAALSDQPYQSNLIVLSRNFGALAAVKVGMEVARGEFFAVMAADLQEPPSLIESFFESLAKDEADIVVGARSSRKDPLLGQLASKIFWWAYRNLVNREIPKGGVDVFGCNKVFRDVLVNMDESNSSLIGLLFWLGFRRKIFLYERLERKVGKSAWTFTKKFKYLSDSVFAFSNFPIKWLTYLGVFGVSVSVALSIFVLIGKICGFIEVPGYAATILVILFFAGLNTLGLGIVGNYVWRVFENTKKRPASVIMSKMNFKGSLK